MFSLCIVITTVLFVGGMTKSLFSSKCHDLLLDFRIRVFVRLFELLFQCAREKISYLWRYESIVTKMSRKPFFSIFPVESYSLV